MRANSAPSPRWFRLVDAYRKVQDVMYRGEAAERLAAERLVEVKARLISIRRKRAEILARMGRLALDSEDIALFETEGQDYRHVLEVGEHLVILAAGKERDKDGNPQVPCDVTIIRTY